MRALVKEGPIRGTIGAIPSKSQLHRLLICAALADGATKIHCKKSDGDDVLATIRCLRSIGAKINQEPWGLEVWPVERKASPEYCILDCGESGSTLRFMLPLVCALGLRGELLLSGRLPQRPMKEMEQAMAKKGCSIYYPEPGTLRFAGKLRQGIFHLPGNVSSQYVTGLLLALPLLSKDSSIQIQGKLESRAYVDMTLEALKSFGVNIEETEQGFEIPGGQTFHSPGELQAQGDWSNAAFWLCAGGMPGSKVAVTGLSPRSSQGDRAVEGILKEMGVNLTWSDGMLTAAPYVRQGVEIDVAHVPDLVPALAALAAVSQGRTIIKNAQRLRMKESDRLAAIEDTLNRLGAQVTQREDGLCIEGKAQLEGGEVEAWGDHRIAMMAAIASAACQKPVTIRGAQSVEKSDPRFWSDLASMGKIVVFEGDKK